MSNNQDSPIIRLRPLLRRLNRFMCRIYSARFPGRRMILLLTTTGRKSGQPRVTPLQYEWIDGFNYVASGWGKNADWVQNICCDQRVIVQIGRHKFAARTEMITAPAAVADFLELRLKRHPLMVRTMLHLQGLPLPYERQDLERLSQEIVAVKLLPL